MVAEARPREATERELVADFADTAQLHGYKVASHTIKHDHEREETTLTIKAVKPSGAEKQGVLKLKKGHSNGEGEGSE